MKKKRLKIRLPLPRKTGGVHRKNKGRGSYDRKEGKLIIADYESSE